MADQTASWFVLGSEIVVPVYREDGRPDSRERPTKKDKKRKKDITEEVTRKLIPPPVKGNIISPPRQAITTNMPHMAKNVTVITPGNVQANTKVHPSVQTSQPVQSKPSQYQQEKISWNPGVYPNVSKLAKAVSDFSNLVGKYLETRGVYEELMLDEIQAIPEDTFYNTVQNAIYHSLKDFCKIWMNSTVEKVQVNGEWVNKTIRTPVQLPTEDSGFPKDRIPTLIFLDRFINFPGLACYKSPTKFMSVYRKFFSDYDGLQYHGWADMFAQRLRSKIPEVAVPAIRAIVLEEWGTQALENIGPEPTSIHPVTPKPERRDPVNTVTPKNIVVNDPTDDGEGELENLLNSSVITDDEFDPDDETGRVVAVKIFPDEELVTFFSEMKSGLPVMIPFNVDLDKLHLGEIDSQDLQVHSLNEHWDFLTTTIPQNIVKTTSPEDHLIFNTLPLEETENMRAAIIDVEDDVYTIGYYLFRGISYCEITEEDGRPEIEEIEIEDPKELETLIRKFNYLVQLHVAHKPLSMLDFVLSRTDEENGIVEEQAVLECMKKVQHQAFEIGRKPDHAEISDADEDDPIISYEQEVAEVAALFPEDTFTDVGEEEYDPSEPIKISDAVNDVPASIAPALNSPGSIPVNRNNGDDNDDIILPRTKSKRLHDPNGV